MPTKNGNHPPTKLYLDQFGHHVFARTRKELVQKAPVTGRISKMYLSKKDGTTVHCGYVIGSSWFVAYVPYEIPT
jgi:hypothetical protein